MGRIYIDCRDYPSDTNCTVALSADSEDELLEAAVQHAVQVHQHQDTPELRSQLKTLFKEVAARKYPYNAVVVRVGFDRNEPSPVLTFKGVGLLSEDDYVNGVKPAYDSDLVRGILANLPAAAPAAAH